MADDDKCTGVAARWCPIHGDCICPEDEDGSVLIFESKSPFNFMHGPKCYVVHDPFCPIHGWESDHPRPGKPDG
jgi:hypothetical protein